MILQSIAFKLKILQLSCVAVLFYAEIFVISGNNQDKRIIMIKASTMDTLGIRIDSESSVPKYLQIVNSIIADIERGLLLVGQRIPSINEISEDYYLSRDTVEKAYNCLKEKQIIISAKGKGYYVARQVFSSRVNILFLINKLSSYKLQLYNSFVNSMRGNAHVDLNVYHCDQHLFLTTLQEGMARYDYFIVMPHFKDDHLNHLNSGQDVLNALRKIPEDKLLIIDNHLPGLKGNVAAVYQDFCMDIYEALEEGKDLLKKYQKLILVFPRKMHYPYPVEIIKGFKQFCFEFNFDFEVIDEIYQDMELRHNDVYITIEESDLVNLVKQTRDKNMVPGKDIGIISYNDTPLKDLLGITVISTDFKVMGETAAYMVLTRKKEQLKNVFRFINRNSV
jgi:DNA-binding transcriptional regulator YhcF (GntR family)